MGQAVSGPRVGERLRQLPARHTTWSDWHRANPTTKVLSDDTGFRRDYSTSPYRGYERSRHLYFDVSNRAPKRYHPKALVLGVSIAGEHRAYPFSELAKQRRSSFVDEIGGETITVHWDAAVESAYITQAGVERPATTLYWFAWYTFHPGTSVFRARPGP